MSLIEPYGGKIVNLIWSKNKETNFSIVVDKTTETNIYNLWEWIYSPLDGFMKEEDFLSVLWNMRLANAMMWPIPVVFSVDENQKIEIEKNKVEYILLKNQEGEEIAILENKEIYSYDKVFYKQMVYRTTDNSHPWVMMVNVMGDYLIWGKIKLLKKNPIRKNQIFGKYYLTPSETREEFESRNWSTVVAFQTRNPPHRSHEYLQKCALESVDGLFINPVIGEKKEGDVKDKYIIKTYELITENYYNPDRTCLWILPLTMQYAGPREAVLHAIIRQNFGCSHIIIWRDHAGVGDFYGAWDAQNIFDEFSSDEIQIKIFKFDNAAFCRKCETVTSSKTCNHTAEDKIFLSWTKLRWMLKNKEDIPREFMRKEVSKLLENGEDIFIK